MLYQSINKWKNIETEKIIVTLNISSSFCCNWVMGFDIFNNLKPKDYSHCTNFDFNCTEVSCLSIYYILVVKNYNHDSNKKIEDKIIAFES